MHSSESVEKKEKQINILTDLWPSCVGFFFSRMRKEFADDVDSGQSCLDMKRAATVNL